METMPFGSTGHHSTRVIFGAASLWSMKQEKADQILDVLLESGVNHTDAAASYGDAELRIGPSLPPTMRAESAPSSNARDAESWCRPATRPRSRSACSN